MKSLTRRTALRTLAGLSLLLRMGRWSRSAASADRRADRRLVIVLLRGALDGLAAVPPFGDKDYWAARKGLALPAPGESGGVLDLDGFFGLHPALAPLHEFYLRGEMIVVPAVAMPYRQRLHDGGYAALERSSQERGGIRSGWLNRALSLTDLTACYIGPRNCRTLPLILCGGGQVALQPALNFPDLNQAELDLIVDLCHRDKAIAQSLAETGWSSQLQGASENGVILAAQRWRSAVFKAAAEQTGRQLAAKNGPRIAVLEAYGWDTHANQGTTNGRLALALTGLAEGLEAFAASCGTAWRQTAVLLMTEFGRSVAMNAMKGTDHGIASVAFLIGGAVAGRRVIADWPGLKSNQLHQGRDLAATLDLRAIIKSVLESHLGLPQHAIDQVVLPGASAIAPLHGLIVQT
jgi:uncharacterized protein (DUF1501 family)